MDMLGRSTHGGQRNRSGSTRRATAQRSEWRCACEREVLVSNVSCDRGLVKHAETEAWSRLEDRWSTARDCVWLRRTAATPMNSCCGNLMICRLRSRTQDCCSRGSLRSGWPGLLPRRARRRDGNGLVLGALAPRFAASVIAEVDPMPRTFCVDARKLVSRTSCLLGARLLG